jgi:hypothetical protein
VGLQRGRDQGAEDAQRRAAVPIEPALVPLLVRMAKGKPTSALVAPVLEAFGEDHLAELFREHLLTAGVKRAELHESTRTHVQSNFRSWRDSGITWLAIAGVGVDKIMRRAGHDVMPTTMGYVKLAEDLSGDLGLPFAPLPPSLLTNDSGSSMCSVGLVKQDGVVGHEREVTVSAVEHDRDSSARAGERERPEAAGQEGPQANGPERTSIDGGERCAASGARLGVDDHGLASREIDDQASTRHRERIVARVPEGGLESS